MSGWRSLAQIVADTPLSDDEIAEFSRLSAAITHAIDTAGRMPTTLDARARALVVTKLQEAEHWSLEMLRIAALGRSRSSSTS